MDFDVIVVGGGIAGLTATAYLTKAGYSTLLCEKENSCGGLINTFKRDGFSYDGGIRAMENSGILFPMLKQLGLHVEFVKNMISVGIKDRVIRLTNDDSAESYKELLTKNFPDCEHEIIEIFKQIRKIMHYMEVQYGIDNPAFLDIKEDRNYFIKVIIPWMVKYLFTVRKITALNQPVLEFLKQYTKNQSLLDIIAQHFFQNTPAFFALSYIKLYLDYYYPLGGTGTLIDRLVEIIEKQNGVISTNSTIVSIDHEKRVMSTKEGKTYGYRRLIWAADMKSLYRSVNLNTVTDDRIKQAIRKRHQAISDKSGNDSILTVYLAVDIDKSYFAKIATEHFFYTPSSIGQSVAGQVPTDKDRQTIEKWLQEFFALTTYEISIPVLRDATLAPDGKTGLIVSVLFDYRLTKHIEGAGWYDEFKALCEECVINTLNTTIYPGIKEAIIHQFSSTPLSIARITGNSEGAITGWSFKNDPMPAEYRLPRIFKATQTPIPGIVQAGQWTYSPSGLPISILTGKLASDRVKKEIKS